IRAARRAARVRGKRRPGTGIPVGAIWQMNSRRQGRRSQPGPWTSYFDDACESIWMARGVAAAMIGAPRKAVKTAKGRKKVIAWLKMLENQSAQQRPEDPMGALRLHVAVARTRRWRRATVTGSRRGVRQCGKAR